MSNIFKQCISSFLIFLFVISGPLTVYGQEAASDTISTTEISTTPTDTSSTSSGVIPSLSFPDETLQNTPTGENSIIPTYNDTSDVTTDTQTDLDQTPPLSSSMSLSGSNPSLGDPHSDDQRNAIANEIFFKQDPIYGSLNYSYPLPIPTGRGKLTPDINLSYNNQAVNNANIFGYGWSVSIPSIERINKTGTNNIYSQDYFYSFFDGELASTSSTTYGALAENGNFYKYAFSTSTGWLVTDKIGTTYKFGTSTLSRQDDPNDSTRVYKWMLDEIRDTNNNYIRFSYYKDNGQIYPDTIKYTGNGTTDGIFEIDFLRENRSDIATSSHSAFSVISHYRVSEIDVKVNGTWVKKYILGYTTGDNGVRSLLNTITEQGQDDLSQTITLPPTNFSYQASSPGWVATSTTWNVPLPFTDYHHGGVDQGVRIADVNGDGLQDVIQSIIVTGGTDDSVYINNGNGWTLNSNWTIPLQFSDTRFEGRESDTGVRIVDVNGDGLPDLFQSLRTQSGSISTAIYLNTGSGWTQDSSWYIPVPITHYGLADDGDVGVRLFDINGDGLVDMVQGVQFQSGATTTGVYLNTGNSWVSDLSWHVPLYLKSYLNVGQDTGVRVADVNGDGLVDIVQSVILSNGSSVDDSVYINTGKDWVLDDSWVVPLQFSNTYFEVSTDTGVRFVDINGDGLPDLVKSIEAENGATTTAAYLNTGSGWVQDISWNNIPFSITSYRNANVTGDIGVRDSEADGDNMTDFMQSLLQEGGIPAVQTYINISDKVDFLTNITNKTGGTTTYQYKQTPLYYSGSGLLNPSLPIVLDTIHSAAVSDGLGTISTSTYNYSGGNYYFNNSFDRKLGGFNNIITTDNAGNYTNTFYHIGDGTDSSHGQYADSKAKIGKIYRKESYNSNNNLYSKIITRLDETDIGNGRKFVFASSSVSFQYDGGVSHKDKALVNKYESTYGNLFQNISYGEVTGADDGTFTDTGTDLASTTISYAASTTPYIVGLPSSELVQDQSSNKVKETKHYYDNQSIGVLGVGNETKTEFWKSSSNYASTTKTYDGMYGLVTQEKDGNGNSTTYTLDSNNLYVATSTNSLGQATGFNYDYVLGKPKSTYDVNGRLFTTTYDAFRRPLALNISDPATGALVTKTSYVYTDSNTPGATSIQQTDNLNSATSTVTYTYFDGLGRNLQQRKQAEGTNTYAVKDWTYNNLALINSESLPYFASSSSRGSATSTSALFTTYTYDALQRVSTTTNAVGSTGNAYNGWTLSVIDPNGKIKDYIKDAYDNLSSVVEHATSSTYTTAYTWDLNKNLTKITDALGNVRNFTYDGVNRRLTAQDLHDSTDVTFGSWSYTYDDVGNLTQQIDPKSQTVNFTYDSLNRQKTEDYTGQAGTEITYTYDSCLDGKGRLCNWVSSSASSTMQYNPIGLVKQETRTIGKDYSVNYSYDRQGNIASTTYPDGSQVQNIYNSAGHVSAIQRKESTDSNFTNVVSSIDYSPLGQPSYLLWNNGATTVNTYDLSKLYRLTRKYTSGVATTTNYIQNTPVTINISAGTGDGHIIKSGSSSWSTTHDASSGTSADSSSTTFTVETDKSGSGGKYILNRGYLVFDTSSIPLDATISTTTLNLWVTALGNSSALDITVATSTQAATSTLATSDFPLTGSSYLSNKINGSSMTASATTTWTLYATSSALITKGGWTKLSLREKNDIDNVAPTETTATKATFTSGNGSARPILSVTYSTSTAVAGTPSVIQDISYTYDPVGNITQIVNNSDTHDKGTTTYVYDDLYRLTSASTTGAVSNFIKTYSYNSLGNITSSDLGSYVYAGNTGSSYANPHAMTSITGAFTATYDNNGNLVTYKPAGIATSTYSWDYRNRIVSSSAPSGSSNYIYDTSNLRLQLGESTATTTYPWKIYNVATSSSNVVTITKHIFLNNEPIADIQGTSTQARIYYLHTDHLQGTNVVSNSSGIMEQLLSYYPYGGGRINEKAGTFNEQRQFIGQEYDPKTSLSYLQARYYDGARGAFISQDPSHLALGDPTKVQQITTQNQQIYLMDPQQLNSYSYAKNNPIVKSDPTGNNPYVIAGGGAIGALYGVVKQMEYDRGSGRTSIFSEYAKSATLGAIQGLALTAALVYGGTTTVLEGLNYYQSFQGVREFNDKVLSKGSINYTDKEQRITAAQVWMDGVQRLTSVFTPAPAKGVYDALYSTLSSVAQISQQFSSKDQGVKQTLLPKNVNQNNVNYVRNESGLLNIKK